MLFFSYAGSRWLAVAAGLLFAIPAAAQVYKNPKAPVEERVKALLADMTLAEKLDYIGGYKYFSIRGIERLGLPEILLSDGPVGVRGEGKSTAYPASVLTAASWDTAAAHALGRALGQDAKARGVHVLLGPGVNIYRAPMNGRNFEYLGEDPYLAGQMAVSYIKGVQSQGVVATVKHFAGNNQEWDRNRVSSDIDERTLQEIYLPAFRAAVQQGHVGAVMNSYNLVNGVHATQNAHLNNDILKGRWGFDGILMSDWVATYDGVAAAKAGLDLEMPSAAFMNSKNLLPALQAGTLSEEVINDKVRRILRIIFRYGFYDRPQLDRTIPADNPATAAVALNLARGGIVLLKNEQDILPLNSSVKSVALIGPNAKSYAAGGGSSLVPPFHSVSLLQGLQALAPGLKVSYTAGTLPPLEELAEKTPFYAAAGSQVAGLKAEYFTNQNLEGAPAATRNEAVINHVWPAAPDVAGLPADHFAARYTGVVRPTNAGLYKFAVKSDDGVRLFVDGKLVIDNWHNQGPTLRSVALPLEAGQEHPIKLEYYENGGGAQVTLGCYVEVLDFTEATRAATAAQVAVVAVGFDNTSEGEGSDRTFSLPEHQVELINAVAKANPNTVVVLNAGGNVDMTNWLPATKALVQAWYPGQEGGTALAEILLGKINPSGKLPASFERQWADNPTHDNYYDPDGDKRVAYKEGLNVGYRYYDQSKVKPQFSFGFGLSYTTFGYSNLKVVSKGKGGATVSFTITNTGKADGAEVAQVYVHQAKSPVARPLKELKGFTKVFLKKGEARTVTVPLDAAAFSYFKTAKNVFGYDPGSFDVLVGSSSALIKLKASVQVK
ncbi:glycoside hydrolase family 3 C-terminal domain-containing protein [Hymenobacter sp. BT770]|uniref:beta-glucosidase family protein n=1 Tax=Hymenobacter sp. BT770 TaxID=2886942 RepID=UPI001D10C13A|nr:glycoside hydrolase family 3 C-terminal domain-containing protein [Hymenobacter sp. BT770]MCC3153225.1 glycoside hydrolase family 3 C-terminal domain-containing protein [Hymenobacter sp. BT770]MDO3414220.1 glycoside hydrolase family 3 C-terminal domain-containing protein [Hymenobacter sp. BT770]